MTFGCGRMATGAAPSMTISFSDRAATSSLPEDLFTTLFGQVFGLEKTLLLAP
jgi:hypothetical protein